MCRWQSLITSMVISILVLSLLVLSGTGCKTDIEPTPERTPTQEPLPKPDNNHIEQPEPTPERTPTQEPLPKPDNNHIEQPDPTQDAEAIIINHKHTDISKIPLEWIRLMKANLRILYFRTSHGNQITLGMQNLQSQYGNIYDFNEFGDDGALSYQVFKSDLGHKGDLTWETLTRSYLDEADNNRNIVIWAWCGGVSDNTEEGIDIYLNAMNQLEIDYPNIKFVYMTGHLDGTGELGNLNIRNNQIRDYAVTHNKILFDFADIESYDPDGNRYLEVNANDDGSYDGGNWAEEWAKAHPDSDLCIGSSGEHTHYVIINLKARAFWWLLARIAGWDGQ